MNLARLLPSLCLALTALFFAAESRADSPAEPSPPTLSMFHMGLRAGVSALNLHVCPFGECTSPMTPAANMELSFTLGRDNFQWLVIAGWASMPGLSAFGYAASGFHYNSNPQGEVGFLWEESLGVSCRFDYLDWPAGTPGGPVGKPGGWESTSGQLLFNSSFGLSVDRDWAFMVQTWLGNASGIGLTIGRFFEL
jgi:hypothetical protein